MKAALHNFNTVVLCALVLPAFLLLMICVGLGEWYARCKYGEQYEEGGDV